MVWGMQQIPHGITLSPGRMPPLPPEPEALVRAVTGAVLAVNANLRLMNAAMAAGDAQDLSRAMAALNAAVADQTHAARSMLKHVATVG